MSRCYVCAFPRAIGVITHLSLAESLRVVLWVLGRCGGHRYFVIFSAKKFAFEEDFMPAKIDFNQHQNPFRFFFLPTSGTRCRHYLSLNYSWFNSPVALSRFRPQTLARSPKPFKDPTRLLSN